MNDAPKQRKACPHDPINLAPPGRTTRQVIARSRRRRWHSLSIKRSRSARLRETARTPAQLHTSRGAQESWVKKRAGCLKAIPPAGPQKRCIVSETHLGLRE